MYLFFDSNGTLLEIVNDVALRQYNTNVNKIYVYIQDKNAPESGKIPTNIVGLNHWYKTHKKESIPATPVQRPISGYNDVFVEKSIPYNRNRDLKRFVYGRKYEFFVLDIPSGDFTTTECDQDDCSCVGLTQDGDVFNISGTVLATIQAVYVDTSCLTLEQVAFTVEDAVLMPDQSITGSQFAWLLREFLAIDNRIVDVGHYDNLENIPITNQDLNEADFTPSLNTYYRHIGEDGTFSNGLVYFYNGRYISIDGGTSLELNGAETDSSSIYAPTSGGDNSGVQVLVPHGNGNAPTWETVSIEHKGLKHTIKIGSVEVGTIELKQETYIDDVIYDASTHVITFKYNEGSGKDDDHIDLSSLVDVYTAGNGLQKEGNEFSIKTNSSYLSTSADGLSVAAQTIANLAKIKLNNTSQTSHNTTFYAPTSSGSNNQVLFANGSSAPTWGTLTINNGTAKGKSIFAPTSSRYSNSTNSCYVLVPNGTSSAPVWKELEIEKNNLLYTFKLGGIEFGRIQLTQEVYLDSVDYKDTENKLVFTYNTASGKSSVEVDLTDLVDIYSAGNGLEKSGNAFSVKIADGSEKYLQSTENGVAFDESALPTPLPQVTAEDAGKVLGVDENGAWTAQTVETVDTSQFIVTTEAEFNALLVAENVGKTISYNGDLYLICEQAGGGGNAPIEVGDQIAKLYFNTSVTPDFEAIKNDSTIEVGFGVMYAFLMYRANGTDIVCSFIDANQQREGLWGLTIGNDIVYVNQPSPDEGISTAGWQKAEIEIVGGGTVQEVSGQSTWGSYISKEPFTGGSESDGNITAKLISYGAGNGLQKEGNEFSIKTNSGYLSASASGLSVEAESIANLATIKLNNSPQTSSSTTFYAPTTSRSGNTANSCYVLVPNGTNSAPVWKELEIEKSNLLYTLKLGGVNVGEIQLTQEVYLDSVTYDDTTNKLVFTYDTASGKTPIEVDLTDLVDVYTAGNGLQKSGNAFSVKIANGSENYLQSTADGLVFDENALPTESVDIVDIDTTPTENSTNLVTSGGVYTAIKNAGGLLPQVTTADTGKFLRVDGSGNWVAETIPSAEGMSL